MNFYPVNLNITNKKCVLIGGGSVALRKLRALLECQPEIVIISPDVNQEIADLITKHTLSHEKREYHKGDLNGAFLCIAATNDHAVQAAVALEAEEKSIAEQCDRSGGLRFSGAVKNSAWSITHDSFNLRRKSGIVKSIAKAA